MVCHTLLFTVELRLFSQYLHLTVQMAVFQSVAASDAFLRISTEGSERPVLAGGRIYCRRSKIFSFLQGALRLLGVELGTHFSAVSWILDSSEEAIWLVVFGVHGRRGASVRGKKACICFQLALDQTLCLILSGSFIFHIVEMGSWSEPCPSLSIAPLEMRS